ncbi:hypothetical protein FB451DRAFT_1170490 [Mycena latifolia]|nr:hypothetical protein FB451DRAFT_1170490 [Mycena latifolia]
MNAFWSRGVAAKRSGVPRVQRSSRGTEYRLCASGEGRGRKEGRRKDDRGKEKEGVRRREAEAETEAEAEGRCSAGSAEGWNQRTGLSSTEGSAKDEAWGACSRKDARGGPIEQQRAEGADAEMKDAQRTTNCTLSSLFARPIYAGLLRCQRGREALAENGCDAQNFEGMDSEKWRVKREQKAEAWGKGTDRGRAERRGKAGCDSTRTLSTRLCARPRCRSRSWAEAEASCRASRHIANPASEGSTNSCRWTLGARAVTTGRGRGTRGTAQTRRHGSPPQYRRVSASMPPAMIAARACTPRRIRVSSLGAGADRRRDRRMRAERDEWGTVRTLRTLRAPSASTGGAGVQPHEVQACLQPRDVRRAEARGASLRACRDSPTNTAFLEVRAGPPASTTNALTNTNIAHAALHPSSPRPAPTFRRPWAAVSHSGRDEKTGTRRKKAEEARGGVREEKKEGGPPLRCRPSPPGHALHLPTSAYTHPLPVCALTHPLYFFPNAPERALPPPHAAPHLPQRECAGRDGALPRQRRSCRELSWERCKEGKPGGADEPDGREGRRRKRGGAEKKILQLLFPTPLSTAPRREGEQRAPRAHCRITRPTGVDILLRKPRGSGTECAKREDMRVHEDLCASVRGEEEEEKGARRNAQALHGPGMTTSRGNVPVTRRAPRRVGVERRAEGVRSASPAVSADDETDRRCMQEPLVRSISATPPACAPATTSSSGGEGCKRDEKLRKVIAYVIVANSYRVFRLRVNPDIRPMGAGLPN